MDKQRVEVTNLSHEQKVSLAYDGGWSLLHDIAWEIKTIIVLMVL